MEHLTEEQKQIVTDNMNLVHYVIKKNFLNYIPGTDEYDDIANQGFLGLCVAVMNYDKNASAFSTYAYHMIWGYMISYLNKKSGWAFHIRKNGSWKHIPYGSLNIITTISDSNDSAHELSEIIPDNKCDYKYVQLDEDIRNSFKQANCKYGEKILDLLYEGLTQKEIAFILETHQSRISRIIKKAKDIYFKGGQKI